MSRQQHRRRLPSWQALALYGIVEANDWLGFMPLKVALICAWPWLCHVEIWHLFHIVMVGQFLGARDFVNVV